MIKEDALRVADEQDFGKGFYAEIKRDAWLSGFASGVEYQKSDQVRFDESLKKTEAQRDSALGQLEMLKQQHENLKVDLIYAQKKLLKVLEALKKA